MWCCLGDLPNIKILYNVLKSQCEAHRVIIYQFYIMIDGCQSPSLHFLPPPSSSLYSLMPFLQKQVQCRVAMDSSMHFVILNHSQNIFYYYNLKRI